MTYRLHCFAQSGNAYKAALMLNLCRLPWQPVFVDFFGGATRQPGFREDVNALGEVPVLEGDGRRLSQSGVILTYLADKTGLFAPQTEDERYEALRWILFDNHKFTSYFATYRFMNALAPTPPDPAVMAFLKARIDTAFGIAERHLQGRPFLLGARPTIADLSLCGYLFYPKEETGYDLPSSHPAVAAWTGRIRALPGFAPPYELMPGHPRGSA